MAAEINLISEIREAEKRAGEINASARAEAEEMIEKLHEEYRKKTLRADEDFHKLKFQILERARCDADAESLRMDKQTEGEIDSIRKYAEKNFRAAEDFLIKKILE